MEWACTTECTNLNGNEVHAIIKLKESFDQPVQEVRQALDVRDSDYPNLHFTKLVRSLLTMKFIPRLILMTGSVSMCMRKRLVLTVKVIPLYVPVMEGVAVKCIHRAAAMHYPLLTKLLRLVYSAMNSHKCVQNIDNALSAGD